MIRKPHHILADDASDPRNVIDFMTNKPMKGSPVAQRVRLAHKIVLDDNAAAMAVRLSHSTPKQMLEMLEVAVPPSEWTWIEWPSQSSLDERARLAKTQGMDPSRFEHERSDRRMALLIHRTERAMEIACVEHHEKTDKVFEWPCSFSLSLDGDPVGRPGNTVPMEADISDSLAAAMGMKKDDVSLLQDEVGKRLLYMKGGEEPLRQTAAIWGYGPETKGLKCLNGMALATVPMHYRFLTAHREVISMALRETRGITRLAVATLALLNTATQTNGPEQPSGRHIGRSGLSRPFMVRSIVTLNVPKRIRNADDYVRRAIRDEADRIRKRLHKVSGHFRHKTYRPRNCEGWVPCFCPGRPKGVYWHKYVAEHMRGDETLGIVERDYAFVRSG